MIAKKARLSISEENNEFSEFLSQSLDPWLAKRLLAREAIDRKAEFWTFYQQKTQPNSKQWSSSCLLRRVSSVLSMAIAWMREKTAAPFMPSTTLVHPAGGLTVYSERAMSRRSRSFSQIHDSKWTKRNATSGAGSIRLTHATNFLRGSQTHRSAAG